MQNPFNAESYPDWIITSPRSGCNDSVKYAGKQAELEDFFLPRARFKYQEDIALRL